MTLLVTGGCGFIGSEIIRQAVNQGRNVVNIDSLTYAANQNNLNTINQLDNYEFKHIDICDRLELEKVFHQHQPSSVIHCAAESHVDRSINGPSKFINTNVIGTFNLLESAKKYECKFLHISTDEVYGDLQEKDPAFTEESLIAPSSPYSASKAASDHLVRAWGKTYNLPFLITNCSNNYGPYQFPEKLIPVVILACIQERKIPIYGKGDNIRDWLFVSDHVKAILEVLDKGVVGETYNIGGGNELKNIEIVKMICEIMDKNYPRSNASYSDLISFVADRKGHDRRYAVNASKIRSKLGWKPTVSIKQGLKITVDWYVNNKEWWMPIQISYDSSKKKIN